MLMEQTLQTLNALRLPGMATAFAEQQTSAASMSLPFDERFAMLVDREHTWRENRRVARLLPDGHFKIPHLWPPKIPQAGPAKL